MKISTVMNIKNKKDRYYSENTKTDEAKYIHEEGSLRLKLLFQFAIPSSLRNVIHNISFLLTSADRENTTNDNQDYITSLHNGYVICYP